MLKGKRIVLRSLECSDLAFLDNIENNKENWQFGSERKQYSLQELDSYIKKAKTDIFIAKQYRFIIDLNETPIGIIDLFNCTTESVEVGIIVTEDFRYRGFARESVNLVVDYVFSKLYIKIVYATVSKINFASNKLFNSCGFQLHQENHDLQYFIKLAKNQL